MSKTFRSPAFKKKVALEATLQLRSKDLVLQSQAKKARSCASLSKTRFFVFDEIEKAHPEVLQALLALFLIFAAILTLTTRTTAPGKLLKDPNQEKPTPQNAG